MFVTYLSLFIGEEKTKRHQNDDHSLKCCSSPLPCATRKKRNFSAWNAKEGQHLVFIGVSYWIINI